MHGPLNVSFFITVLSHVTLYFPVAKLLTVAVTFQHVVITPSNPRFGRGITLTELN